MVDGTSDDALTSLLSTVRLRASVFGASELAAPWGVSTEGLGAYVCYVIPEGSAVLAVRGTRRALPLLAGGVALVRAGMAHELKDSLKTRAEPFERLRARSKSATSFFRGGGTGARTQVICGTLEVDEIDRALFDTALPPVVSLKHEELSGATRHLVAALTSEAIDRKPGASLVLTRLAELLFVQVVRACIGLDVRTASWLRGVGHPAITKALAAIHRAPGEAWTLERLAEEAMMSRSTFAETFHDIVGETPFAYLTSWRMRAAAQLLASSDQSLKVIASTVGYASDEAFSRAFRAWAGMPPGAYRGRSPRRADT
ncbi:AraC family transcriptional regulator [Myxococcus sp. CA051A]|uniref:AraC family transcriptional regulator n=1 Tax=Myxococcus sp. CA051A TaxID=2741739 RepID=UPI00157B2ABB|nr:AraC family transcriptional regulator [Myxococcus sp. CA051A]NTX66802.1 AraC family transcriptional regulator [Myxococcus sp. CA051A]